MVLTKSGDGRGYKAGKARRAVFAGSKEMNLSGIQPGEPWDGPPIAIFWDQSLVWGLLCIDTLRLAGIPFTLVNAAEIGAGCLRRFRILLVPGGWAAHKVRALGEPGKGQIARFLEEGGAYIGFCGGAGMALSSSPGLYLTPIERMPLSERLPSASGSIHVRGILSHPAWQDIPPRIPVSVWWPSQFRLPTGNSPAARPLALYDDPATDFRTADIRVSDLDAAVSWRDLEKCYGINLDPGRIKDHPAIIEVQRGRGRLVLSCAHLETPGDAWGNRLFFNTLSYLNKLAQKADEGEVEGTFPRKCCPTDRRVLTHIHLAKEAAADLIAFGEANLLWNWRNPWLLNWRRGVRGLEYGTLFVTLACLEGCAEELPASIEDADAWLARAGQLEKDTTDFCVLAKRLLLEEKVASQTGIVSKLGKVNERVDTLRAALFGTRMNHGGLCRTLFDLIDGMLLDVLKDRPEPLPVRL